MKTETQSDNHSRGIEIDQLNDEQAPRLKPSSADGASLRKTALLKDLAPVKRQRRSSAETAKKLQEMQYHPTYSKQGSSIFSWQGRMRRSLFFVWTLVLGCTSLILGSVLRGCDDLLGLVLLLALLLLCSYVALCTCIQRAHDIGWSGVGIVLWWLVGVVIQVIQIVQQLSAVMRNPWEYAARGGDSNGLYAVIGMIVSIPYLFLFFADSQSGSNEYGPSPKGNA